MKPLVLALAAIPLAAAVPAAMAPALAAPLQPQRIGQFDHWQAYKAGTGKAARCYALSIPVKREPEGLNRDPGYLFVSEEPRNEISLEFGFPVDEATHSTLVVGDSKYELAERQEQAWIMQEEQEQRAVAALKGGLTAIVRTRSARGNETTDTYSLKGFSKAYETMMAACD